MLGTSFGYTLEVTNLGPSDAVSVSAADPLPAGILFDSSGDGCSETGGTVTCPFGDLAVETSASRSFTVTLDPSLTGFPLTISNVATVSSSAFDPQAANDSAAEDTTLDPEAPRVTRVDSVAATADGELSECETVYRVGVSRLRVSFSEAMYDPPGDVDPGDVTNPASWQLVGSGSNTSFDTIACGAPAGDDELVVISAVTYDVGTDTGTLELAGGVSLADGLYRLFACGTGASPLRDQAGSSLDGDADLIGGDDFVRSFRADPENQLANGHFDCDLGNWFLVSTDPLEIVHAPDDADGSADSGSVAVENLTQSTAFALGQCAPVVELADYRFEALVWMSTMPPGIGVTQGCSFFDAPLCLGGELGDFVDGLLLADTGGAWAQLAGAFTAPAGASSVLCSVDFVTACGATFEARVDQVRLLIAAGIFSDGFESGDTSAWSTVVP